MEWFDQIRTLAGELGFALRQKDYKKNPDAYPGSIADAAAVIRVLLTGSRQSPDLEQAAPRSAATRSCAGSPLPELAAEAGLPLSVAERSGRVSQRAGRAAAHRCAAWL